MNETVLNNSVVKNVVNFLTTTVQSGAEAAKDTIGSNIPQTWMTNIILLMAACLIIFVASKLTGKVAKFVLYVLGAVLIIGMIISLING